MRSATRRSASTRGDRAHRLDSVVKVVAAGDPDSLEIVARTYGAVARAGVHRAPSIRVAEAAKVIENVQRDVNIALMNELALIFARIGLDTGDVLAAAGTKWNFLPFRPASSAATASASIRTTSPTGRRRRATTPNWSSPEGG